MNRLPISQTKQIRINNYFSELKNEDIPNDILYGLKSKPKYISAKYFYDEKGSRLFEKITNLDEYYQTRSEKKILANIVPKINFGFGASDIIELGSGDHSKITLLLKQLSDNERQSIRYMPADISRSALEKSCDNLHELFPKLTIEAFVIDFMSQLNVLPNERKRLFCFFGGTIGNFSKLQALDFLRNISHNMRAGDMLLLGFDRVKDIQIIEKAYNDSKGVTADFNKNIIDNVNKLAGLNINRNDFEHLAFYNTAQNRIEMHLKAAKDLKITRCAGDEEIRLSKDETIHTENSHKFNNQMIEAMASASGLNIRAILSDEDNYFGMSCMMK